MRVWCEFTFIIFSEFRLQFLFGLLQFGSSSSSIIRRSWWCWFGSCRRRCVPFLHTCTHFMTTENGLNFFRGFVFCKKREKNRIEQQKYKFRNVSTGINECFGLCLCRIIMIIIISRGDEDGGHEEKNKNGASEIWLFCRIKNSIFNAEAYGGDPRWYICMWVCVCVHARHTSAQYSISHEDLNLRHDTHQ